MLAYTLYAIHFVVLMTPSTNCLHFSALVLLVGGKVPQDHQWLLRCYAIVILTFVCLTFVCLTLLCNRNTLSLLNNVFACFKLVMLFGIIAYLGESANTVYWHLDEGIGTKNTTVVSYFLAFLHILFAFSGWENPTFVP